MPTSRLPTAVSGIGAPLPERRRIKWEIGILLGLSLGRSAIYSIIELIARLTAGVPLGDQATVLNPSRSPRPYLDLTYQLYNIIFALMPVALALYFLAIRPSARPLRETLGLDWFTGRLLGSGETTYRDIAEPTGSSSSKINSRRTTRITRDWLWGLALCAAVGIPGLLFYVIGRALGITVAVQASAQAGYWWTIPVLILAAFQNGALEEIIVVGYLYRRTQDLGWSQTKHIDWRFLLFSAVLRASYHLYQGIGPFFGNFAMGLLFAWWFQSHWGRKRIIPLIIAHTLIDTIAFVGYQFAPDSLLRWLGFA